MLDTALAVERERRGADAPIAELDLTRYGVLGQFARSTRNPRLMQFLLALDRVDRWAVDFDEEHSERVFDVRAFVHDLQSFVDASVPVLHRVPREFADILAHVTTTRCIYLLRFVGERNNQFVDALARLLEADGAQSANIAAVRRRLEAFSKARLLGEIFSGRRLTRIMQIMGSYADV